jgi:L-lactate dehydrogenase (cytochrome)
MSAIVCTADFERAARARLPRFLFDYADGGANVEITLGRNKSDLADIALRQRVLQDVATLDLSTDIFGRHLPIPVILSPIGIGGMYRRRGEVQAARAANRRGLPFGVSTVSLCGMQEIAGATVGPLWFQLYVLRDRGFMADLIATAKKWGAEALIFTVDMPVPGSRYRDAHSGMAGRWSAAQRVLQAMGKPAWTWDVGIRGRPHKLGNLEPILGKASGMNDYMGWLGANFDPSIRWSDLEWIRSAWDGPLIIKGILDPEDARAAAAIGAQAIVVSNHGGRQLDGVLSTTRALPAIAQAVGDRVTVMVDGGVRSGIDVVKMIALGARAVLIGRPWLWALAAQGEAGVTRLLDIIEAEMRVAMTLTGVNAVEKIDGSILA